MREREAAQKLQTSPIEQATSVPNNLNFISEVVQAVGPAVVRINATRTVEVPGAAGNPLIERFLARNYFLPSSEFNAVLALDLSSAKTVAF